MIVIRDKQLKRTSFPLCLAQTTPRAIPWYINNEKWIKEHMKIEYILVLKENKNPKTTNIKPRIQNVLKKCYVEVSANSFKIKYKRIDYLINYECVTHQTGTEGNYSAVYYLTFSHGTSKNETIASVLDYVHECFISNIYNGESKFHVMISYDERALYFCSRAYPYFFEFESKLRCLILKLLTQTFGALWAQKTLSEEHIKLIKEKIRSGNFERIASEALYEMDISTLEAYLFAQTRKIPPEYVIDNNLNPKSLKELDAHRIGVILDLARPKSNWERYFADKIVIEQLQDKLTIIREERNKIAHIKHYCKKDFDEDKLILSSFNDKLEEAIYTIEVSDLIVEDGVDVITTFSSYLSNLSSIKNVIVQAISEFQAALPSVPKTDLSAAMRAIQAAQASVPKTDLSAAMRAIQAAQASVPKTDLSAAMRAIQTIVPKTDLKAFQANLFKNNMQELQSLRKYVLSKENKND